MVAKILIWFLPLSVPVPIPTVLITVLRMACRRFGGEDNVPRHMLCNVGTPWPSLGGLRDILLNEA